MPKYNALVRWPAADGETLVEIKSTVTSEEAALRLASNWAADKLHPEVLAQAEVTYLGKSEF